MYTPSVAIVVTLLYGLAVVSGVYVHPDVHRRLAQSDKVNVFVTMKKNTNAVLSAAKKIKFPSRSARLNAVAEGLAVNAADSQRDLLSTLRTATRSATKKYRIESFWIANTIYIGNADAALIAELKKRSDIAEIQEEEIIRLDDPTALFRPSVEGRDATSEPEWGIKKIGADQVWNLGGRSQNMGQGVLVGSIDTGVRGTHEILRDGFVGEYGWFDPDYKTAVPTDENGHGTHTMGTIVGGLGVGVAPKAKWMSCRGCGPKGCSGRALIQCAQFMACPTDPEGKNPDCSRAPHLVSNSWGGGQGMTFYNQFIEAWHAAGIIPIFAMGNAGPKCSTANSPGDQERVIAVGATNSSDGLAFFSSVGPTKKGLMKPEISAPGHQINSAFFESDTTYKVASGTSMACPHIAGVVALLVGLKRDITYEEVKKALLSTAVTSGLINTGLSCGGADESYFPNNMYGHGRVNAFEAFQSLRPGFVPRVPGPTPAPTPAPLCAWDWATLGCTPKSACRFEVKQLKCVPI